MQAYICTDGHDAVCKLRVCIFLYRNRDRKGHNFKERARNKKFAQQKTCKLKNVHPPCTVDLIFIIMMPHSIFSCHFITQLPIKGEGEISQRVIIEHLRQKHLSLYLTENATSCLFPCKVFRRPLTRTYIPSLLQKIRLKRL